MSKSVADGSTPPQWMRDTANRLAIDDLSPMTPPSNDGFYFPFPVANQKTKKLVDVENTSSATLLNTSSEARLTSSNQSQQISQMESDFENKIQSVDFSRECKKYISAGGDVEKGHFPNSSKPKGTDDDFKTAACAGSLVKVAQKFVGGTGNQFQKRFTVAKIQDNNDDHAVPIPEEEDNLITDPKLMQRRNSRSLPSSPKTMRKFQQQPNPYFTITAQDNVPKTSWFLTGLFGGIRREMTPASASSTQTSTAQIDEADEIVDTVVSKHQMETKKEEKSSSNVKAKPTMMREMNFWAPSSY
uniref:CSON007108 protein n=1 Tax=Culicoides sonorensis TaxID=179676 RepID=A0A336MW06_CULSO